MSTQSFSVAGVVAASGERTAQLLNLTLAGVSTQLPLFVLNGAQDGPTVVITAAIHGAEYVGTEAAMRLAHQIDPKQLRGQLVIVPIVSMIAYKKRAIYICPPDDKNLNRMFPGNAQGSFAEQLADWLFQNLIRKADAYLDLHGGDLNEALVPFSIVKRTGNATLDEEALALAEAFGLPDIVASEVKGATVGAAADVGIPAVLAEVGGQGVWNESEVQQMVDGLLRSLTHVGLIDISAPPAPATRVLSQFAWLRSEQDGLWHPKCQVGDTVKQGQVVGEVVDYLGNLVQTASAPINGTVLFLVTTLAMNIGDPLLAVGA